MDPTTTNTEQAELNNASNPTPPATGEASNAPSPAPEAAPAGPAAQPAAATPATPSNEPPAHPKPTPKRLSPAELAAQANDDDQEIDAAVEKAIAGADVEAAAAKAMENAPAPTSDTEIGQLVEARVANVGSEDVLVDFGGKRLGTLPKREFRGDVPYQVGDSIEVLVTGEDKDGGLLTVSHKQAKQEKIMQTIEKGMILEGPVTGMNRGGLEVDVEGLRCFIPASQVDIHFKKDISDLIGKTVRAEVTKFDKADKNIVLSRRNVLEVEAEENKRKAFQELSVGQTVKGKVKNVADYGAFVDLGGVDGLLHISDMSWGRVEKPENVVNIGDEVEVKVIKVNQDKGKISLSLKEMKADPWTNAAEKYQEGSTINGRVVRLAKFGAFVELEPGLDGLLPLAEMSWTKQVRSPKEVVNEGDVIQAKIINCDIAKHRISLSLKAMSEDPWTVVANKYPVDSKVKGKVVRTTEFGAFVNLEDGIDGLIHISELSDKHVAKVESVVKSGDEVEARVVKLDTENKRIGLSLKEPPPEPTAEELAKIEQERIAAEKRRNKKRRGGLTIDWGSGLGDLDPSKFAQ